MYLCKYIHICRRADLGANRTHTQTGWYITAMKKERENAASKIYVKTRLETRAYSGLPEELLN